MGAHHVLNTTASRLGMSRARSMVSDVVLDGARTKCDMGAGCNLPAIEGLSSRRTTTEQMAGTLAQSRPAMGGPYQRLLDSKVHKKQARAQENARGVDRCNGGLVSRDIRQQIRMCSQCDQKRAPC